MKRTLVKQILNCNISQLQFKQFSGSSIYLQPNTTYILQVTYPLRNTFDFPLKVPDNGMDSQNLINKICEIYRRIYKNEEKYGIWGHDIEDLAIQQIIVNHKTKKITLSMGS